MFNRTPSLVRPVKLLLVLRNRLYRDNVIDPVALDSYNPGGTLTFPIQYVAHSASMRGQNATYTGHGADIVETMFTGTLTRRRFVIRCSPATLCLS